MIEWRQLFGELSVKIGLTKEANSNDTAGPDPTNDVALGFRSYRKSRPERHSINAAAGSFTDPAGERLEYDERTDSRVETGLRVGPSDTSYGYDRSGQPLIHDPGDLMRARLNVNGRPADRLGEPTDIDSIRAYEESAGATSTFIAPDGDELVGVAAGFVENDGPTATRSPTRNAETEHDVDAPVDREASSLDDIGGPTESETVAEGVETADLRIALPGGAVTRLGDVVDEPERYSRSSLDAIEARLALEAELRKVTDGIHRRDDDDLEAADTYVEIDEDVEIVGTVSADADASSDVVLVGFAKQLYTWYETRAAAAPSSAAIAQRRTERARAHHKERIRPLLELESDLHDDICQEAKRFLNGTFDRVYEVRKSPLSLAIALAEKKVNRGMSVTDALFAQADEEETDPRNVVKAGNVRYTAPKATNGYLSTQGSVAHLFETTAPDVKQAGYLRDEIGEVKFTIWKQTEWEETKPTPDPTDTTGHTLIAHHEFPDLVEGDVVRFETVRKSWFKGEAQLETRRDSDVTIIEASPTRAVESSSPSDDVAQNHRPCTPPAPSEGNPEPKPPIAHWRGRESWMFPMTSWMPDWWTDRDAVEFVDVGCDDSDEL